jgi:hypothetical protein
MVTMGEEVVLEEEEMEETPPCQPLNHYVHSHDVPQAAATWSEAEAGTQAVQTHGLALQARARGMHSKIWRTRESAS